MAQPSNFPISNVLSLIVLLILFAILYYMPALPH